MEENLRTEIARIAYWKEVAAQHDRERALRWTLPRVGATDSGITEAEQTVGFQFPHDYRDFLKLANGWTGFHVLTDLYGTEDFRAGRSKEVAQNPELQRFIRALDVQMGDVSPIGSSDFDLDVFLLFSSGSPVLPGGVLWYASEEIDRFDRFSEFLSAMVNYNAQIAQRLGAEESRRT